MPLTLHLYRFKSVNLACCTKRDRAGRARNRVNDENLLMEYVIPARAGEG